MKKRCGLTALQFRGGVLEKKSVFFAGSYTVESCLILVFCRLERLSRRLDVVFEKLMVKIKIT